MQCLSTAVSMRPIIQKHLALMLGCALLSACSSAPGTKEIPTDAEFSTRILADNTKLFTLKVGHPGGDRASDQRLRERDGRSSGGSDCFPCGPGDSRGGGSAGPMRTPDLNLKAIATAMIADNHFCREGFVVLEQFQKDRSTVIRGECRDSANASDRARFTQ